MKLDLMFLVLADTVLDISLINHTLYILFCSLYIQSKDQDAFQLNFPQTSFDMILLHSLTVSSTTLLAFSISM